MEDFAAQLTDKHIQDKLFMVLNQRKPFRRFKDTLLDYPKIREQWFKYHDKRMIEYIREWLDINNIDAELSPLVEER